jgi:hypothetical protein
MGTDQGTLTLEANGKSGRRRGPGHCKSCGQKVYWCVTVRGKSVPLDVNPDPLETLPDGSEIVSEEHLHWMTCPMRNAVRRVAPTAAKYQTRDDEEY